MDKNSFFWKMLDGRLPPPPCAGTLGMEFLQVDGERGSAEIKLFQNDKIVATATATAIIRKM